MGSKALCVCACVRACARARVRACARARARARVRGCVCVSVCVCVYVGAEEVGLLEPRFDLASLLQEHRLLQAQDVRDQDLSPTLRAPDEHLPSSGRQQGGVGVGGRSQQGQGKGPEGREPALAFATLHSGLEMGY